MKTKSTLIMVIMIVSTFINCNSDQLKKREDTIRQKEIELQEKEDQLSHVAHSDSNIRTTTSQQVTKYVYVVVRTDQPKVVTSFDDVEKGKGAHAISQLVNYTSDIVSVSDYTEDKKFMLLDKYENGIRLLLEDVDKKILSESAKRNATIEEKAKVLSRSAYVFGTYTEASTHRAKHNDVSDESQ